MKSICPHCGTEYPDTPDEYLGMTCECEACHNDFVIEKIKFCSYCGAANVARAGGCSSCGKRFPPNLAIPKRPPAPSPTIQEESEGAYAVPPVRRKKKCKKETESSNSIWQNIKIVFVILIVGGGIFWGMMSDELSADKVARDVETKEMAKLFGNKDFIYHGALVQGVTLTKDKSREKTYSGEVRFARNNRSFKRPISVTYNKNGSQINYRYGVDFDYSKHPEFLEEDADIFFNSLKEVNQEMKTISLVSSKSHAPGVVRCIVRDSSGDRAEMDIKVEERNNRFSYEIINIRDLK